MRTNAILDDNTLFLDNSSLEEYTKCPARFNFSRIERREPITVKPALSFGGAIHLALKLRYKVCGREPVTPDIQARQMYLLGKFWERNPTALGDYRTCELAQQTIHEYNRFYQAEPFHVCTAEELGPIVEEPFAALLGVVSGINIMWTGRMDLSIVSDNSLYVLDHKTTSMGGDYVSKDYPLATQFKGYAWFLRHIKPAYRVAGAIANIMVVRKPAKTSKGKGNEFLRVTIPYTDDVLDEWQENTLRICEKILVDIDDNKFSQHPTQCVSRYGLCPFFDVCTLAPGARQPYLNSSDFSDNVWTPFREDELSIDEVLEVPREVIDQYKYSPADEQAPDIKEVYTSLLQ